MQRAKTSANNQAEKHLDNNCDGFLEGEKQIAREAKSSGLKPVERHTGHCGV